MRLPDKDIPNTEDLDAKLEAQEKIRENDAREVFHWIRLGAISVTAVIAVVIVGIYVLYLILPEGKHWLNQAQISHIEKTALSIITGVAGTFSISYFLHKK